MGYKEFWEGMNRLTLIYDDGADPQYQLEAAELARTTLEDPLDPRRFLHPDEF